jgi:alpha-ribazole phosphatase
MDLWLVRHAQPLVEARVCYGALDVPADPQATAAAATALASALPHGIQVRVSPLQRCEQLAQTVRGLRPDLTFITDFRLAEMDFGGWEGRHWDALPRAELDAWTADFSRYACGGGECVQKFMLRVSAAWAECVDGGATAAWITHAGVIRAVRLLASGLHTISRADQWPLEAPAFGGWELIPVGTKYR